MGQKNKDKENRRQVEVANDVNVATVTIGSIGGDTAHDAADANDPLKIGGKANAAQPSAVDEGDRTDAWFDLSGRLGTNANVQVADADASSSNRVPIEIFDSGGTTVDVGTPKLFGVEVALGNVSGTSKVNKFGEATDCDSGVDTDIWDGADGSTSTDIWVAPTQARTHTIATTSTADDFSDSGTGARTIRVYGLQDWDSAETNEDIELDGNGANAQVTANSYVIIHRIKCLTFGSGGTNAGTITATATTDGTITAAVQPNEGQTLMCIYGIPSTQTAQILTLRADALRTGGGAGGVKVDGTLLVKENADLATAGFVTKERFQFADTAALVRIYTIPKSVTGPAIIKFQVSASVNNTDVAASFDAYIVNN